MTVLLTLTTAGADSGPLFNLYSNINYSIPLQTGVAKSALQSGYTLSGVPDGATIIRITSTGTTCTNSIDVTVTGGGSTTTTTTSNTTAALVSTNIYPYCSGTTRYNSATSIIYDSLLCGGNGGGGTCLIEGTEITMLDGSIKKIEDLTILDKLRSLSVEGLSSNEANNETWSSNSLVLSNCEVNVVKCEMITTSFMKTINNGLLTVSDSHIHLVKQQSEWKLARTNELSVGDYLVNEFGIEVEITNIESLYGEFRIYDLGVEDNDLYIANGILTHNK